VIATSLFAVCSLAFLTVFLLLAFLALVMHLITEAFPVSEKSLIPAMVRVDSIDPAMVAAITGTVATIIPGARVTMIEEEK
jgi:hypothetical protein